MLLEHQTPMFDNVQQSGLEWLAIDSEPLVNQSYVVYLADIIVDLFVCVDLVVAMVTEN